MAADSLLCGTDGTIPPECDGQPNPVETFRKLIENDSALYMLANGMFDEIPTKPPYDKDPTTLKKQVRNYKTMLYLFNTLLKRVPEWFGGKGPNGEDIPNGLIGFPFNIIVDWPMGTASGRQFFLDPRVNDCLKDILNLWGKFLKDPNGGTSDPSAGNRLLREAGWNKPEAIAQLERKANEATPDEKYKKFQDLYEVPIGGCPENFFNFSCWDEFFTRKFKEGIRPVADSAVVSACESFPLAFDTEVSRRSTFWLKGTPYSLRDMLGANDEAHTDIATFVNKFAGGTVYQAFLSADSYHCWHAPATGQVVYRSILQGTYYAETAATGFGAAGGPDPAGPDRSQRYITHMATRGILIIDTDKGGANIGLVCFIPVGMSEVSTCEWFGNTHVGNSVSKGDLIGAFHAGGSTHALVFQKSAMEKLEFNPKVQYPETSSVNIAVNSRFAWLR
ncbi:hypothetical protein AJ79_01612 [Helicocarpus griseus UAMH5409]|uniref:L-tryptophan decarboxylase PsiD-like domain-containing protein n=1 Tax=Helicocarpus griseus UAMH5409 TaxID=1447875 RepID=A0A2B7Y6J7_9EURO|nr:hypothetical protein AJ79_01612 [Helicocarpus griseus UAMH5409]